MNSDDSVRAFLAVEVSDESRRRLAEVQGRLKACAAPVAWVRPDNMHLTLLFLGQTDASLLAALHSAMDKAAGIESPFTYELAGLGWFGKPERPRVIWAGVREESGILNRLQRSVVAAARAAGLSVEEEPYVPHLTLGRVKGGRPADLQALRAALEKDRDTTLGTTSVAHVSLYASTLTPQGPIYRRLHLSPLRRVGEVVEPRGPGPSEETRKDSTS